MYHHSACVKDAALPMPGSLAAWPWKPAVPCISTSKQPCSIPRPPTWDLEPSAHSQHPWVSAWHAALVPGCRTGQGPSGTKTSGPGAVKVGCCIPTSLRAAWSSSCARVAAKPSSPTERVSSRPAQAQHAWVMEALQATSLGNYFSGIDSAR